MPSKEELALKVYRWKPREKFMGELEKALKKYHEPSYIKPEDQEYTASGRIKLGAPEYLASGHYSRVWRIPYYIDEDYSKSYTVVVKQLRFPKEESKIISMLKLAKEKSFYNILKKTSYNINIPEVIYHDPNYLVFKDIDLEKNTLEVLLLKEKNGEGSLKESFKKTLDDILNINRNITHILNQNKAFHLARYFCYPDDDLRKSHFSGKIKGYLRTITHHLKKTKADVDLSESDITSIVNYLDVIQQSLEVGHLDNIPGPNMYNFNGIIHGDLHPGNIGILNNQKIIYDPHIQWMPYQIDLFNLLYHPLVRERLEENNSGPSMIDSITKEYITNYALQNLKEKIKNEGGKKDSIVLGEDYITQALTMFEIVKFYKAIGLTAYGFSMANKDEEGWDSLLERNPDYEDYKYFYLEDAKQSLEKLTSDLSNSKIPYAYNMMLKAKIF